MKLQEHFLAFSGYLGNIFLAVASFKMKDVDLLLAIILKIFTIISTSCITIYYIKKLYNENNKKHN